MKYPELSHFADLVDRLHEFDAIIDVRTEAEYALDHVPGAINCPVLDDEQRIVVGTTYKQVGAFEAKKMGAAMVARNIAQHIDALWQDKPRDWRPLVYCWRGGNRSGAMAHILAKIGWPVAQLDGGYKDYRQYVSAALERTPALDFRVLCGTTGSGKSRLLQTLESVGAQVLDLEQLAAHRGSVLGSIPSHPQPSQKAFESAIWDRLRRFDPALPVFVESESKKVGELRVPGALMDKMRASPCVALRLSREHRVALLMQDYAHYTHDAAALNEQLGLLAALHGRDKINAWRELANAGRMAELVGMLLSEHYDPAYLRSIDRNFPGNADAQVLELPGIAPDDFRAAALALHRP
ncbi:tRNA 2-selenouridine(34) synthase MnmH [Pseudoduganella namucuonensis]|uniref:tRNA 2-selenouridine synthase n=1 Tax=Pseudoduganella namucuonensis TaxID=1035707 RepID=A0A1I7HBL5_9BURK|nr:tRNA 2-selenouridine(34) synthase MnmH [Pseudoduganella namucuonensis]SFU58081.1 tRNA 2-selenouridine synthase [Pseudoduganella namucuonensis]